jgi:hypothetical protein
MTVFINIFQNLIQLYLFKYYPTLGGVDILSWSFGVDQINSVTSSQHTETKIIHDDGNWSNSIRTLFIYGAGAFRLMLNHKGGNPGTRAFTIAGTIATDTISKIINNTINDPNYLNNHKSALQLAWYGNKKDSATVTITDQNSDPFKQMKEIHDSISSTTATPKDQVNPVTSPITDSISDISTNQDGLNNFLLNGNNINNFSNNLLSNILDYLKHILEPVSVNYSNELLANQINDLGILLFILSLLLILLTLILLINILVLINSHRITTFFTNKYIKWYVNLNMKLIKLEVICLGGSILYFLVTLSKATHFIATHPINFTTL